MRYSLHILTRLSALAAFLLMPLSASAGSSPLATVGHVALTRLDLTQTQKAQSLLANSALADTPAFVHLVGDTLQHEVAAKNGMAASPADLDALAAHADTSSKDPDLLAALKAVFGTDTAAYRRLYLQPIVESDKLHAFYTHSSTLHVKERVAIESAYRKATGGEPFAQIGKEAGLTVKPFTVGGPKMTIAGKAGRVPSGPDPLLPIVQKLSTGQMNPNIVENDSDYCLIRLTSLSEGVYTGEMLSVPKRAFDSWYALEAAQVPVAVADPALAQSVSHLYGQVAWVKRALPGASPQKLQGR
ncbi:MAG: hypothetical protein ACRYFS_22300 [Janthinobacterium lividum]